MFKKGLATVAAGSLAVLGLAAPAQAATAITLAPLNGTSTGAIVGSTFMLKAGVAGAGGDNITFTIEGADVGEIYADIVREDSVAGFQASEVTVSPVLLDADADGDAWGTNTADAGPDGDADEADDNGDGDFNWVNANDVLAVSAAINAEAAAGADDTGSFTANNTTASAANPYYILALALDASEFEDGVDLTVTAFEDGNLNGIYDADLGEVKSSSVVVSFIPADEVTGTVTQVVTAGAPGSVQARVTYTNVNMGSMEDGGGDANDIDRLGAFEVLLDGAVDANTDLGDAASLVEPADFNDTFDQFRVTATLAGAVANGSVVVTRAYAAELAATTANRLAQARTGLNDTIDAFVGDANGDPAHIEVADSQNVVIDDNAGDAGVRPGDGTFTVFVDAEDADNDAVGAGEEVVFTISEDSNTFDSAVKLTAGGKSLTNSDTDDNAESIEVVVKTDADGRASLTISYEDLDDADTFTIDATVVGSTAAADLDFTADDADAMTLIVTNVDTNGSQVAESGDRISVTLSLRDEYGLAPANDHRAAYTISSAEMNANITGTAVFSGGSGDTTISWTDTSDDIADITFAITGADLEAKDADGDWVAPTDDPVNLSHTVVLTSAQTVDSVVIDDAASDDDAAAIFGFANIPLNANDVNSNFDATWATLFDNEDDQVIDIDVLDEDNVGLEGIAVTVSGTGIYFADEGQTIFSPNSITVYTDANGNAIVDWDSNVAGETTITVTAGGKTDTIDVTVTRPSDDGDTDSWSISGPAYVAPQSTMTVTATLLDEWGNGVNQSTDGDIEVTYSGPGLQVPAVSTLKATSTLGVVQFGAFLGASDTGTYTVTFTHEGDDGDLAATDDNVVGTYTFTIGEAPVSQKVNAGSFKGYVAVYAKGYEGSRLSAKVGKDWVVVPSIVNNQENGTLFRVVEFTGAGYDVAVRIYIDRVLVDTINLTTK
jgi:hypothetical protein